MSAYRVVNRGDGPKIEGTRITVYQVLEYVRAEYSREWIAATLGLSSRQVQAAMDYIRDHDDEVNARYEEIMARVKQGNPPWVEERLTKNRAALQARLAKCRPAEEGVAQDGGDHVGQ